MRRLLPILLALTLAACAALVPRLKAPELQVYRVVPIQLGLAQQRFAVTLTATNDNDRSVTLEAVELELRSGNAVLAQARSSAPVSLPAHGRSQIELLADTSTAQWLALMGRLTPDDLAMGLPYTLEGRAQILGWGWLPFRKSGRWSPTVRTGPAPH